MDIKAFPLNKGLEKHLRLMDQEGADLTRIANEVRDLINNWELRYIKLGADYIAAGGDDPDVLNKVWMVTKTREIFGIFK